MKKSFIATVLVACLIKPVSASDLEIAFINPGGSSGFWGNVAGTMSAAGTDLDVKVQVLNSDRDRFKMVEHAKDIAARAEKPDFVVLVNELQQGPAILKELYGTGIKTFFLLNKLTEEQESSLGKARTGQTSLLGSITPDNEIAGYEMAKSLIAKTRAAGADKDGITMLALTGDNATPASLEREAGLKRALNEYSDTKLVRSIPVQWDTNRAYERTKTFLERDRIDAIWAANDPISFGAQKAAMEAGLMPGVDVMFAGLNWSKDALDAVKEGRMALTHGGHFFAGAWTVVLLRDYADGLDFADKTPDFTFPMSAVDSGNVDDFIKKLGGEDWEAIDFKVFSKSKSGVESYDFSSNAILSAVN